MMLRYEDIKNKIKYQSNKKDTGLEEYMKQEFSKKFR